MATRSSRSRSEESEGEGETVWIAPNPRVRSDAQVFHTDLGCRHVDPERFRGLSKERATTRHDLRECATCAGEVDRPGGGTSEHLRSLKAAAAANAERTDDGEG